MGLSMAERKAVTKQLARRYEKATKTEKGQILTELCALTGWTRRHARRALLAAGSVAPERKRREPVRIYDTDVLEALKKLWRLAGGPCGKRFAPFIGELVQALEHHGELVLDPLVRHRLLSMSAATMDRALKAERRRLQVRGRHGTKPGTLLKHQIPIRTFSEWNDAKPGFCELDLVAHCGENASGEFCQTLDFTDVSSGWTEMRAVPNKAQRWVFDAIGLIRRRLPFALLGIDSDNGSEFINDELYRYCTTEQITFTRGRAYHKNDGCYVEQKNWTHVRQMVGYNRYEGPTDLRHLNELYDVLRLWQNFFNPQQKLLSKTRDGARVTRRYDSATTPYRRLLASPDVAAAAKKKLRAEYESLNPAELSRRIGRFQQQLTTRAALKRRRAAKPKKEVKPPLKHRSSRTSSVRQRRVATRTS